MTRKDKLLARLLSRPKDFTYTELATLMKNFGYVEIRSGKTSGSRVAFSHPVRKHIIRLHRPHPGNVLKLYQVSQLIDELIKENLL